MKSQALPGSGELFSQSYSIYRNNLVTCLILGLLSALPMSIFSWVVQPFLNTPNVSQQPYFANLVIGGILGFIGALVITAVGSLTLISYVNKVSSGQTPKTLVEFGNGFDKLLSWLWLGLIMTFWVSGGFLLLIIPGIILMIRFSVSSYVLVVENERGLDALMRSRKLVRGYTWQTLSRWIVPYLPFLFLWILGYFLSPFMPTTSGVVNVFVSVILTPMITIYGYFLYKGLVSLQPQV